LQGVFLFPAPQVLWPINRQSKTCAHASGYRQSYLLYRNARKKRKNNPLFTPAITVAGFPLSLEKTRLFYSGVKIPPQNNTSGCN